MGLTWRDLVSSAALLGIVVIFVAYKVVPRVPLVSSASMASIVALLLAVCCALAAAIDLHTSKQSRLG